MPHGACHEFVHSRHASSELKPNATALEAQPLQCHGMLACSCPDPASPCVASSARRLVVMIRNEIITGRRRVLPPTICQPPGSLHAASLGGVGPMHAVVDHVSMHACMHTSGGFAVEAGTTGLLAEAARGRAAVPARRLCCSHTLSWRCRRGCMRSTREHGTER